MTAWHFLKSSSEVIFSRKPSQSCLSLSLLFSCSSHQLQLIISVSKPPLHLIFLFNTFLICPPPHSICLIVNSTNKDPGSYSCQPLQSELNVTKMNSGNPRERKRNNPGFCDWEDKLQACYHGDWSKKS